MTVEKLERVFRLEVNNKVIDLDDPNTEMTVDEVIEFYSSQYPMLMNAIAQENVIPESHQVVYDIKTIAGTKG